MLISNTIRIFGSLLVGLATLVTPICIEASPTLTMFGKVNQDLKEISFSEQFPLNKMFTINLAFTKAPSDPLKTPKLKKFDARMPAHKHGMITTPKIMELAPGKYLIEGVKFHMPGLWEMIFEIDYGTNSSTIVMPLKL